MWGGRNNQSPPDRFSNNGRTDGESPSELAAAALAARMAIANGYDINPSPAVPAATSYFDVYGAAAGGQPAAERGESAIEILYAQRDRELELFHLQQQMQERQSIENEARTRLLDYSARNQIQEYERSRIEMALIAEIHQRDQEVRMEAERSRGFGLGEVRSNTNGILSPHELDTAAAARSIQDHKLVAAAYLAQQKRDQAKAIGYSQSLYVGPTDVQENSAMTDMIKDDTVDHASIVKKQSSPREVQPTKKNSPKKKKAPKKDKGEKNLKEEETNEALQTEEGDDTTKHETTILNHGMPSENFVQGNDGENFSAKKRKTPSKSPGGAGTTSDGKAKKARKSPNNSVLEKSSMSHPSSSLGSRNAGVPSMDDIVPEITDVQYENVQAIMNVFCKVPILAEFSRPVSLLHPELVTLYSKIVTHPMDLGHICRAIRRREYKNTRAIQLDVWQVFSNCIRFHLSPTNKENAIPSFISIANHLRIFFNSLWQEYMMPSDAPPRLPGKGISFVHSTFQKRAEARKERLPQISSTILTPKCMLKLATALESFIQSGGKVDNLDKDAILGDIQSATGDIVTFTCALRGVIRSMQAKIQGGVDYTVLELHRDVKKCYTEDVFEHEILKKMKISQRLDRILGKIFAPIHESSCRGVNQSSIWGCMAAAVWARESKKKPYWPAIVLGILAPDDQKEDWHQSLTERNESRLPEKLRNDLSVAKRRAEQGLKKTGSDLMSYFLVEFMGSHEFIWVKESDIIENFDPDEDVNIAAAAGNVTKKKRSTAFNSKQMSDAIEEGRWALEEFELQLNNTCGDRSDDEGEFDESGYTYDSLCQSDNEADETNAVHMKANKPDVDELNELLAHDGVLDFSIEGRKKAKAKAAAIKKENALIGKVRAKPGPKPKSGPKQIDAAKFTKQQELDDKRAQERRVKRSREHDKLLNDLERNAKKVKSNTIEKKTSPNEVLNKRDRAETIAKGFLMRRCIQNPSYTGAAFQPTSTVEPSGLLGMALAFRAAAGEVPYLDSSGLPVKEMWETIDTDSPVESAERCERLREQIDLISKEIVRVDADTERRLALVAEAEKALSAAQQRIIDAESDVRSTFVVKKKTPPKKKGEKVLRTKTNVDVKVHDNMGDEKDDCLLTSFSSATDDKYTEETYTDAVGEQFIA